MADQVTLTLAGDLAESALKSAFVDLAAGRPEALAVIWEQCGAAAFSLALWRTGSRDEAADIVQDVFVKLAQTRAELGRVVKPRSYVLAMTHRAAVDRLRRRRPLVEIVDELLEAVTPDPERAVDAERASRALAGLPAEQREAVLLRHFEEFSFAEIARVTGVPTFTAASRVRLGIARLRRILGVKP